MSAFDYTALDPGPGLETSRLRPFALLAGVAGVAGAAWAGLRQHAQGMLHAFPTGHHATADHNTHANQARWWQTLIPPARLPKLNLHLPHLSLSFFELDGQNNQEDNNNNDHYTVGSRTAFVPRAGMDTVLVRPGPPFPPDLPEDWIDPKDPFGKGDPHFFPPCLFYYGKMVFREDRAALKLDAWIYGAKMGPLQTAYITGDESDILRGVIQCFKKVKGEKNGTVVLSEAFIRRLIRADLESWKRHTQRGAAWAVTLDGQKVETYWYYAKETQNGPAGFAGLNLAALSTHQDDDTSKPISFIMPNTEHQDHPWLLKTFPPTSQLFAWGGSPFDPKEGAEAAEVEVMGQEARTEEKEEVNAGMVQYQKELKDFQKWLEPLMKSCEVEVKRGLVNIQGKLERFNAYVYRSLISEVPVVLDDGQRNWMWELAQEFRQYPKHQTSGRRNLVARLNIALRSLKMAVHARPPPTAAPPIVETQPPAHEHAEGPGYIKADFSVVPTRDRTSDAVAAVEKWFNKGRFGKPITGDVLEDPEEYEEEEEEEEKEEEKEKNEGNEDNEEAEEEEEQEEEEEEEDLTEEQRVERQRQKAEAEERMQREAEMIAKAKQERARVEQMMRDKAEKEKRDHEALVSKMTETHLALKQRLEEFRMQSEQIKENARQKKLKQEADDRAIRGPVQPGTNLRQITEIEGKTLEKLQERGFEVATDLLLRLYPKEYIDGAVRMAIASLRPGRAALIVGKIQRCVAHVDSKNTSLNVLELEVSDATASMRVTRIMQLPGGSGVSQDEFLQRLREKHAAGSMVAVCGVVVDGPMFPSPQIEVLPAGSKGEDTTLGYLTPSYARTEGLTSHQISQAILSILHFAPTWTDPLTPDLAKELGLLPWGTAIKQIHRPTRKDQIEPARRRLVFDEFLLLQLQLGQRRIEMGQEGAPIIPYPPPEDGLVTKFLKLFPYTLTLAQFRTLREIQIDMSRTQPMARLVQGDVGSGKTVVAIAALLRAIEAGWQGAFIAPTQVLAEQHFQKLGLWLPRLFVTYDLLTSATTAKRKREILQRLESGELKLLVGTHAMLEEEVVFERLGLVVIDEQHRFGVKQRGLLLAKGKVPHLLAMTATPIPRTLALSLHGDLDVSLIDELPPGRTPIKTQILCPAEREEAYKLIRQQVEIGQRAYVVLPLVSESEKMDLRSVEEVRTELEIEFPDLRIGMLHGRMSGESKTKAINEFASGRTDILVSTTVVEVGVDVPEASVMMIEHADRFGLAQLHQLRGRVGRGAAESYCVLIDYGSSAKSQQRLEVLAKSNNGFEIAEVDMKLRGPGQFLGTKQSGAIELALADLAKDVSELDLARKVSAELLTKDPQLNSYPLLKKAVQMKKTQMMEQN